jgi:demethylmenaquinone methyltransferase / 2-methoxy-6-polyprenyl-1,4-benzoquinol methylase
VEFIHRNAEEVVLEGEFDCIASCYLAKYADLTRLASHAHDMLRRGGLFIMHELTYPTGSAHRASSWPESELEHLATNMKVRQGEQMQS